MVCCSVFQSCLTVCDPMDCSMPGFPVLHYILEFAQLRSVDSMMLSNHLILYCSLLHPSIFPSMRIFSNELALHIWWPNIGASASVLLMNTQGWFPLGLTGLIFLQPKGLARVFSSTTVWKHQFLSARPWLDVWRGQFYAIYDLSSKKIWKFSLWRWTPAWEALLLQDMNYILHTVWFFKSLFQPCWAAWWDLSSPTRDWTHNPCTGSLES